MKRFGWLAAFSSVTVLVASAVPSNADDSMATYDWTGAYIGIVGGGSILESSGTGNSVNDFNPGALQVWDATNESKSNIAPTVGGQIGFNWQNGGNLVLGLVGDFSWTGNSESEGALDFGQYSYHRQDKMDMFGTIRGKMGVASGNTLFSASGGLAVGHFDNEHQTITCCPTLFESNMKGWAPGMVIGVGVDHALGDSMIISFESLYAHFPDTGGDVTTSGAFDSKVDVENNVFIARAGLSFKF